MRALLVLDAAGLGDRCNVIGGDFFAAVPTGGNAYVLKMILHDWDDAECVRILRVCRQAMVVGAALLVIEQDLGPSNGSPAPKFLDLNMLVVTGGESERPRSMRPSSLRRDSGSSA
jgi:O-methyltransferase domain